MSREFHEWNPSLEQVEGKDTPQGHKIEVSSEAIEWAQQLLEGTSPLEGAVKPEKAIDAALFQEFPPVKLLDDLTLERMERATRNP